MGLSEDLGTPIVTAHEIGSVIAITFRTLVRMAMVIALAGCVVGIIAENYTDILWVLLAVAAAASTIEMIWQRRYKQALCMFLAMPLGIYPAINWSNGSILPTLAMVAAATMGAVSGLWWGVSIYMSWADKASTTEETTVNQDRIGGVLDTVFMAGALLLIWPSLATRAVLALIAVASAFMFYTSDWIKTAGILFLVSAALFIFGLMMGPWFEREARSEIPGSGM